MNYFELHIGDLTEATAHLTLLEDGAYGRLLRKYYATEKPLPHDIAAVQRLVGARSKDEKAAVEAVLREFFELQDDGWHQSRCDAEIAAFHEKQEGVEGKRENAKERQRRARERRAQLFELLRGHNIVPPWTTTSHELEALLSRVTGANVTLPVTRDDTATQTPDTKHQTPVVGETGVRKRTPTPPPVSRPDDVSEQVWADWLALRKGKKAPVTPTVLASAIAEAKKADMPLQSFLAVWCARGSQGMCADWLSPSDKAAHAPTKNAAFEGAI